VVRLVGGSFVGEGAGTSLGARVTAGTTHLVGLRVAGASAAADVDGGTLEVVGSRLEGGAPTNDGGTLRLGSSMIETSPITNSGTTTCHACFDAGLGNAGAIGDCP